MGGALDWRGKMCKDTIIMFNTIEHIENYKNLIAEIFRVLKKKGNLELFVPFLVMYHPDPKDIFRPTHFYLEKILRQNGFNAEITLVGVGPFLVHIKIYIDI